MGRVGCAVANAMWRVRRRRCAARFYRVDGWDEGVFKGHRKDLQASRRDEWTNLTRLGRAAFFLQMTGRDWFGRLEL
jgi:hypothetical protein